MYFQYIAINYRWVFSTIFVQRRGLRSDEFTLSALMSNWAMTERFGKMGNGYMMFYAN